MGETWTQHPSRRPGLGWPRLAVTPHPRFCWGMQAWLVETKSRLLGTSRTAEQPLILFLSPNARGQCPHQTDAQLRSKPCSPETLHGGLEARSFQQVSGRALASHKRTSRPSPVSLKVVTMAPVGRSCGPQRQYLVNPLAYEPYLLSLPPQAAFIMASKNWAIRSTVYKPPPFYLFIF